MDLDLGTVILALLAIVFAVMAGKNLVRAWNAEAQNSERGQALAALNGDRLRPVGAAGPMPLDDDDIDWEEANRIIDATNAPVIYLRSRSQGR